MWGVINVKIMSNSLFYPKIIIKAHNLIIEKKHWKLENAFKQKLYIIFPYSFSLNE